MLELLVEVQEVEEEVVDDVEVEYDSLLLDEVVLELLVEVQEVEEDVVLEVEVE